MPAQVVIPARRGKAAFVRRGQFVTVINTHGQQVVDNWAFNHDDLNEFMSMEHSRATHHHIIPRIGDVLLTNRRRPILTITEDTSGGVHDTLIAACDRYRYEELGCTEYHDNCTDNLAAALAELGLRPPETPSPFNLFMNIPWSGDGDLTFEPPVSTPGCFISLRAEMDLVVAFSACPQDILPINGRAGKPVEAHFVVSDP
jgi:uncharacterized protein YcgI (DUF1989 family)